MPFWQCYYHIVWATHNRAPIITTKHEAVIFGVIRRKAEELGCTVLAVNGVSDHAHVAVAIPPSVEVSKFVRWAKGSSSHAANTILPDESQHFKWQESYGVITFGRRSLEQIVAYVERQKQHHAAGTALPYYERMDMVDEPLL